MLHAFLPLKFASQFTSTSISRNTVDKEDSFSHFLIEQGCPDLVTQVMSCRAVPKLTAWIDEQEWKEVRGLLYSPELEEVKEGCVRVRIWMDRGRVPTAVESTLNFLEVILSDSEFLPEFLGKRSQEMNEFSGEKLDMFSSKTLRLAYSSAVIRFVNELVDQAQKSAFATSIAKLADQLGLPRFFVDIRHDGTHDQMSSLELLRWAASEALDWLECKYWSCDDERNADEEFRISVHKSIDTFVAQLAKIPGEVTINASLEKNVTSRIISPVDYLFTVERVMSQFLSSLSVYPTESVVIEVIIRLLARSNSPVFRDAFVKLWIVAPRGSSIVSKWINWIAQELTESSAKTFIPCLLQTFAAHSSEEGFRDKLLPFWQLTGQFNSSFEPLFSIFSRAYTASFQPDQLNHSSLSKSQQILQARTYNPSSQDYFDGWSEVPATWKPSPLGK